MPKRFVALLLVIIICPGVAYAWTPPVVAPIQDPWREPEHRFGPGNRGVDFSTQDQQAVRSAGAGTVSFAGQVGGDLYVVVDHAGELRTTYGHLASIAVEQGQVLAEGAEVGTATASVHFGLRHQGEYIDPNILFGRPSLVP